MTNRARVNVELGPDCAREGCDGMADTLTREQVRVRATGLTLMADDAGAKGFDVILGLCGKCKRALAEGRWTPTRQADQEQWRPTEKQLHTTVMGSLNRSIFKTPPEQWFQEIDTLASPEHGKGATADLVCLLHASGYSKQSPGMHIIEVKHEDDLNAQRLERQLASYQTVGEYVWLLSIGEAPEWDDDTVGLLSYDTEADQVYVEREPERAPKDPPRERWLHTQLMGRLSKAQERLEERAPAPQARLDDEVTP